ncbi:MAG: DUF2309 domain-containing protein [Chromatiales bacterium]|jgi:uncharacterized protein YbcC (UPF0753/DUF2309 family)
MVYIAAEQVPFFWPMRAFIHHNPLHGLEHLPFDQAVEKGASLFHARSFLPRSTYRHYLSKGEVDLDAMLETVRRFVANRQDDVPLDLVQWIISDMTGADSPVVETVTLASVEDIQQSMHGNELAASGHLDLGALKQRLSQELLHGRLLYEVVDELYATGIGSELDEGVIRANLDFFDEGQSVWHMPNREKGFFHAWLKVAGRDVNRTIQGLIGKAADAVAMEPENIIARVLDELKIAEEDWINVLTQEFTRLHGWAGFIRWRSSNNQYFWQQQYPADLVDYLAMRLLLELTLLQKHSRKGVPQTMDDLKQAIDSKPMEVYLRQQLGRPDLIVAMAQQIEEVLHTPKSPGLERIYLQYIHKKRVLEAHRQASKLLAMAEKLEVVELLQSLDGDSFQRFYKTLQDARRKEGMFWLQAMESHASGRLLQGLTLQTPPPRDKRPFAKALFCIDTRSERIRRHLESVGDYQTYGIAGFFGVPVSFMELGKGSENHLCPVLLKPKNLVMEMTQAASVDMAALSTLEHAMHELKESVLTPFVTVEAIGLLFGFDMIGKTLMPSSYNQWRKKLHEAKPPTHLMLDKISREQADSVVRAVQRAVIMKAVSLEFHVEVERISDRMVKELREAALHHQAECPEFSREMKLDEEAVQVFIQRLRDDYRINQKFAQLQLERLGRIGFTLEEQTRFVAVALQSIGLADEFSRFILMVGHGSSSENNPYESALDCGACGGSHGLVSARVITQMANKPEVRQRLRDQGIDIPDDTWFVPALHNTTTDEITLHDLALLPPSHLVYLDRLREGLVSASRLSAQERLPTLQADSKPVDPVHAVKNARRNSLDWSQVRPEWGLSRNAYFIIGRRALSQGKTLDGRAFLHSYDYRLDPKRRLLENILTGPLVVGQWINMEHYFSTVDNERFGSGSKVYHNVAGRFGVMTGNYSDLRTGLPSQTVLKNGQPYHQPMRLITVIEAPFEMATRAVENVAAVKRLVRNEWIRLLIIDPETSLVSVYENGAWQQQDFVTQSVEPDRQEAINA